MTTYLTDSEGKFIPATQRPDGTWRKQRRVKEGYIPQEEVPLYESKGKQFAQRKSKLPVGMCPLVAAAAKKECEKQERAKVKKQSTANKQTKGVNLLGKNDQTAKTISNGVQTKTGSEKAAKVASNAAAVDCRNNADLEADVNNLSKNYASMQLSNDDHQDELSKKLKKLKKKIREIESIEARIKSGELKNPEREQLEKVKRKAEILKKISEATAVEQ